MYTPELLFQALQTQTFHEEQTAKEALKQADRQKQNRHKGMKNTLIAGSSALSWLAFAPSESTSAANNNNNKSVSVAGSASDSASTGSTGASGSVAGREG
ncbi:hypothetical protein EG328_005256 [Venturia inaequalis]|uniref:Uncharacterized protein n=1 Tax=Venturia inaequalis TaxID=5025 RepID=A0A8H3UNS3_VENIN|nr:hypothetical protein EG328_005256 [Venturia inaequalis]KAE9991993.1 hypothetical protein EG327_010469 [Venturia inaequalis]